MITAQVLEARAVKHRVWKENMLKNISSPYQSEDNDDTFTTDNEWNFDV